MVMEMEFPARSSGAPAEIAESVTPQASAEPATKASMNPSEVSRTALATALTRAVHSRADPAPLLDDAWGDRLIPDFVRDAFRQGALDTFSCRRPAYAGSLDIFEVDHPATQGFKRKRLLECKVAESNSLHFIAADLATEGLQTALARSSFDPNRPTFFSWLGVSMYLPREANLATLRAISSCAPSGSELVFTYVDQVVFDAGYTGTESFRNLKAAVSSVGESFLSGFDPGALREQLLRVDLQLLEDLDGDQMVARYDRSGVNGLHSNAAAHIAHARVVRPDAQNAV
jgi:O-methyltransferase involved in polyketide biosynthesis